MSEPKDDLDAFIAERTKKNPKFPALLAEAEERRRIGRELAEARAALGLSQGTLAKRIKTSQSVVSKLEGGADVKLSTVIKCSKVLGIHVTVVKEKSREKSRT